MTHHTKIHQTFKPLPGDTGLPPASGPTRAGMSAPFFSKGNAPVGCQYAVYWLFDAGRNLCIETELGGFDAIEDAGFAARQYSPQLFWSADRLMLDISPRHTPLAIQPGQYAVSHCVDADRLHLYRHVRLAMPLPALHHRMGNQPFTFIRGFCGPAGELNV